MDMPVQKSPHDILRTVFGYDQFKPSQREVIENVLQKRDTLAIMPTGGGKSLCYQIPALIFPGLTVVVSPLIALMKDQVEQLHELGVPALFLNSSLSTEEYQSNMERVRSGEIKLLYVAPETLLTTRLFNLIASLPLECLTIDEAHCISEWGHDFRPEYRQLVQVRERFPGAVCLALTATATSRVREDIKAQLAFQSSNEFVVSFNRENLFIEVQAKRDSAGQTLDFLKKFPQQSGIIYCFSRKQVDDLTDFLVRKGFSALPYHAGLEDDIRKRNQERFIRDDVQVIVATIAFGMGINKPDVRFILHYDMPKSIEGYYQEIGRAGRDGLPAHCLMLYSQSDIAKLRHFMDQKDEHEKQVAYQHLNALVRYAEGGGCRRVPLLGYFGEKFSPEACGSMCDHCASGSEPVDITIPVQKFLSCVKRTGGRFAAAHITQVLLGVENEKVLKYGHQNLSTYGIGKELSRSQWIDIARQLVEKGLLERSDDLYQVLTITTRGDEVLRNREPVEGVLVEKQEEKPKMRRTGEMDYDAVLFDLLRKKRKELANDANLPPYVIFSDRTLVEMAAYYPMTPDAMKKIYGVGQVKYQHYGEIFIEVIRAYCEPLNLKEKARQARGEESSEETVTKLRHIVVGEAYNSGQSIDELAAQFQVQRGTILDHLGRYAQEGNRLRRGEDFLSLVSLPLQQQLMVLKGFEELGVQALKPIFERMGGTVSYEDLRILRLHFISRQEAPSENRQE